MERAVIELTGLYKQVIAVQARDIVQVYPHRVWTEIVIIGGTIIKVLESGDEVEAKIKAAEGRT